MLCSVPVTDDDAALGGNLSELVIIETFPCLVHEGHMYVCKQAASGQSIVCQIEPNALLQTFGLGSHRLLQNTSSTKTLQRNLGSASASLLYVICLSSWYGSDSLSMIPQALGRASPYSPVR